MAFFTELEGKMLKGGKKKPALEVLPMHGLDGPEDAPKAAPKKVALSPKLGPMKRRMKRLMRRAAEDPQNFDKDDLVDDHLNKMVELGYDVDMYM